MRARPNNPEKEEPRKRKHRKLKALGRYGRFLIFRNLYGNEERARFVNGRFRTQVIDPPCAWCDASQADQVFLTAMMLSDLPEYLPFIQSGAFTKFLVDQAPEFDRMILEDLKPEDLWLSQVSTTASWPPQPKRKIGNLAGSPIDP